MRSVLHYPNFEPNQRWIRSILLFFDSVQRIIPAEAQHMDSPKMQDLIHWMPDAIQTIAPTHDDTYFDNLNFSRLERAFAKISEKTKRETPRRGGFSLGNNVWLSNSKLQDRVRGLLTKYSLTGDETGLYAKLGQLGDRIPTNKDAGHLIVSYIADRIAKRTGVDTITDKVIPYTVQALDALGASTAALEREGEGLLASAVAYAMVPAGIELLQAYDFQELRQSYEDIREPFHDLVYSLVRFSRLHRQESATAVEAAVERAIGEYHRQFEVYRTTRIGRKFEYWLPIGVQALLGITEILVPQLHGLNVAGIFGLEVMKYQIASQQPPMEHEARFRMLCSLQKRVNQKAAIEAVI